MNAAQFILNNMSQYNITINSKKLRINRVKWVYYFTKKMVGALPTRSDDQHVSTPENNDLTNKLVFNIITYQHNATLAFKTPFVFKISVPSICHHHHDTVKIFRKCIFLSLSYLHVVRFNWNQPFVLNDGNWWHEKVDLLEVPGLYKSKLVINHVMQLHVLFKSPLSTAINIESTLSS